MIYANILKVVKAKEEDAKQIMKIKRQVFNKYLKYSIYQSPKSLDFLIKIIKEKRHNHKIYCLQLKEKVIGYCDFKVEKEKAFLNWIAISGEYQNFGYGKLFYDCMEKKLKNIGVKKILLECFKDNLIALSFYKKKAFKIIGTGIWGIVDLKNSFSSKNKIKVYEDKKINNAIKEEKIYGFSSFEIIKKNAIIKVGLVANLYLNLINYKNCSLMQALKIISDIYSNFRSLIIVKNKRKLPRKIIFKDYDEFFILSKTL